MTLAHLSDDELMTSLSNVCHETRRLLGRLLVHLNEVEARRLELRSACGSLFELCTRRLGMSESEACRRIEAARLVKRFPCLLDALEDGDIHLTGLLLLRDLFTTDNVHELLAAAKGKSKREIQEIVASKAPRPDVLPTLTPLPSQTATTPQLEPLSPSRHRLELTISSEVRDKLERARDLLGHRIPDGNLEAVLETALDTLLSRLEKERRSKSVPAKVSREVFERDGEQCTYTDEHGHRCESRARLEIDHRVPRARDGSSDLGNLRVVCRRHNQLLAEQAFGREHVARQVHLRQRRQEERLDPVAMRALTRMGFREREVRPVLRKLGQDEDVPMSELIRRALRLLVT